MPTKRMSLSSVTPLSVEATVTELSLAIGQLLRRLRTETNPDGLTWSQTVALARLEQMGPSPYRGSRAR